MSDCHICNKRLRVKKQLEKQALTNSHNQESYVFEREKLRTPLIKHNVHMAPGFTDELKECKNCQGVFYSSYNKIADTHHHGCQTCKLQTEECSGKFVNDDLAEVTPYQELKKKPIDQEN